MKYINSFYQRKVREGRENYLLRRFNNVDCQGDGSETTVDPLGVSNGVAATEEGSDMFPALREQLIARRAATNRSFLFVSETDPRAGISTPAISVLEFDPSPISIIIITFFPNFQSPVNLDRF
ncbi:hypothetical protein HY310_00840 [Candidatus Microgenomates bacterium]|nr:hypothetical protein [Candidatus Microgenomates bacterium]